MAPPPCFLCGKDHPRDTKETMVNPVKIGSGSTFAEALADLLGEGPANGLRTFTTRELLESLLGTRTEEDDENYNPVPDMTPEERERFYMDTLTHQELLAIISSLEDLATMIARTAPEARSQSLHKMSVTINKLTRWVNNGSTVGTV